MRTHDGAWNPLIPYLASVMRCPACHEAAFLPGADAIACGACGRTYRDPEAVLDVAPAWERIRRDPWAPPPAAGAAWEREVLDPMFRAHGPIDRDAVVAFVGRWLVPDREGPILDLATGSGWMARRLARGVGVARVIGLDEDREVLRDTQASARDPGMAWVRARPEALPFVDRSVAGIVYVGDPDRWGQAPPSIPELARVLRPGARLVALVRIRRPGWETVWGAATEVLGLSGPAIGSQVRRSLETAGLTVRSWTPIGGLVLVAAERAS